MAASTQEFPRRLAALGELFDFLGRLLDEQQVDDRSAFWVKLAIEEIFTNMVRHGSGGDRIAVELDVSAETIAARLTDRGAEPFDPDDLPAVDPTLPAAERSPGGLGVFIVRSKVDDLVYRHRDGALEVSFTRSRGPADG